MVASRLLLAPARLASRFASSGIRSRVAANKLFTLPPSPSTPSALLRRPFSISSLAQNTNDPSAPTASEAVVDAERSPVDPLAETSSEVSTSSTPASEHVEAAKQAAADGSHATGAEDAVKAERDESPVEAEDPQVAAKELQARTVFVGGLSWNVDNEWLHDEVAKLLEDEAGVVATRVARNQLGKSKGFAFIELATPELAEKLSTLTAEIDHRPTEFRLSQGDARPPRKEREKTLWSPNTTPRNPPSNTIWAGNVSWASEEPEIEELFEQFGQIRRVSLPKDSETGRSRGIAYIEFEDKDSAAKAMESGQNRELALEGRPLKLDYASTQRAIPRGGGGGRGGRGEGRGGGGYRGGDRRGDSQGRRDAGRRDGGNRDGGSRW